MIADASWSPSSQVEPHPDTVLVQAFDDGDTSPDTESDSTRIRSSTKWHGALHGAAYLVVSYILLYPILVSPVVADDYINPFVQADEGGTSLFEGLRSAWKGSTEGASFRPLGGLVGSATTWLMLTLSATFDIGMSTLYASLKFILIVVSAASIAWFWHQFSASIGRRVRMFEALVFVSLGLFTTLQIHAYWSNDPVANYPLVGFGATTLGFVFFGCVMRFIRLRSAASAAIAAIAALAAVSYYELNVSAVMGASLILALFTVRAWSNRALRWKVLLGSVTIVFVPAIFILFGRTVTGDQSQNYGGTTVRLGATVARTFGLGLASSLPGAAWRLSIETLGGTLGIVTFAIAVTVLLGWIGGGWIRRLRRGADDSDGPTTRDPWLAVVLIAAMGTYWLVAVAIQAITVKVQDETVRLGFVYTSYAVGAAVVALGLAVVARSIAGDRRLDGVFPVVVAIALCFVLVQQTVNWRLSEQLNASLVPNRQLLASFDGDATPPERCQALLAWTSGGWPDYYETGMIDGLDVAYEYYFGEPFCDGFVRPTVIDMTNLGTYSRKLTYVWTHPGNRGGRVRAVARSVSFLSYHRITRKPMTVPLGQRSRIVGYPDSFGGASAVYGNPGPDHREIQVWRDLVRPGDVVLDVGANEGLYTVLFAEMGARVVSFEPDPTAAGRLALNLRLNAYPEDVRAQAVYSSVGFISFTSDLDTSNAIVDEPSEHRSVHTVETTTIDDVLGDGHARGIKVDVEGAELSVLVGAQRALSDGRIDVLQLEWNDMAANFGTSRDEVAAYVRSFGYELFRPTADGGLAPTSTDIGTDVFAVRRGFDVRA